MMTEQEVYQKLLPLIQEVTGARDEQITMEAVLIDDLGAESLDLLDLSFLIEETFGITIEADEFERRAKDQMPDAVYEENGFLTEEALEKLRGALPEVPAEKLQQPLAKITLPSVLNVAVFVHLIQRKLAEAQEEKSDA